MGFLDKLLGRAPQAPPTYGSYSEASGPPGSGGRPQDAPPAAMAGEDERAVARYRYLLRTAPPERIEEAHAQAFAQLTPPQRQQVLARLSEDLPADERPRSDAPADLARAATRAEMSRPGYLGGTGAYAGAGMMMMGSMFSSVAGVVIGYGIAQALFGGYEGSDEAQAAGDDGAGTESDSGAGDGSGDSGSSDGAGDGGAGDSASGSDWGDDSGGGDSGGGDFGGGDFGGGDFGGGDFGGF